MTELRRIVLQLVSQADVRYGGETADSTSCFLYSDRVRALGIAETALNRAVLWAVRHGYARFAGNDNNPPKGSLITLTAKGLTTLNARKDSFK